MQKKNETKPSNAGKRFEFAIPVSGYFRNLRLERAGAFDCECPPATLRIPRPAGRRKHDSYGSKLINTAQATLLLIGCVLITSDYDHAGASSTRGCVSGTN